MVIYIGVYMVPYPADYDTAVVINWFSQVNKSLLYINSSKWSRSTFMRLRVRVVRCISANKKLAPPWEWTTSTRSCARNGSSGSFRSGHCARGWSFRLPLQVFSLRPRDGTEEGDTHLRHSLLWSYFPVRGPYSLRRQHTGDGPQAVQRTNRWPDRGGAMLQFLLYECESGS